MENRKQFAHRPDDPKRSGKTKTKNALSPNELNTDEFLFGSNVDLSNNTDFKSETISQNDNDKDPEKEQEPLSIYDAVNRLFDSGILGWEILFNSFVNLDEYLSYARGKFEDEIGHNPEFLHFMQNKALEHGQAGIRATEFLMEHQRTAFIDQRAQARMINQDLEKAASFIKSLNPLWIADVKEQYDTCLSDIAYLKSQLSAGAFPLKEVILINRAVNYFLSQQTKINGFIHRFHDIKNNQYVGLAAKGSVGRYEGPYQRNVLRTLSLNNPTPGRLLFLGYQPWIGNDDMEGIPGQFNINYALNTGHDINVQIDQLLKLFYNIGDLFSKNSGKGSLWQYIGKGTSALEKLKYKDNIYMPSPEETETIYKQLDHWAVLYNAVAFGTSCQMMYQITEDHNIITWFSKSSKDIATYKKQCKDYLDKCVKLLQNPDTDDKSLWQQIKAFQEERSYKWVQRTFVQISDNVETVQAIWETIKQILDYALEIGLTIAAIYTGSVFAGVSRVALSAVTTDAVIVEGGAFASEVLGFTLFSRNAGQMKELITTGNVSEQTSFGEDYFRNFLTFGALKGTGTAYAGIAGKTATSLPGQVGAFAVELNTLTGMEALFHTWDQQGLTPEEQQEFDFWEHSGHSAQFLISLKIALHLLRVRSTLSNKELSPSLQQKIDISYQKLSGEMEGLKAFKGLEADAKAENLQESNVELTELYLEVLKEHQGKPEADQATIQWLHLRFGEIISDVDRAKLISTYKIKPWLVENYYTFEARTPAERKTFFNELSGKKTGTKGEKRPVVKDLGNKLFEFDPPGKGPKLYFKESTIESYKPNLNEIAGTQKMTTKAIKDRFLENQQYHDVPEKEFHVFDPELSNSPEFDRIVVEAIEMGWRPEYDYTLPDGIQEKLMALEQRENVKQIERQLKKLGEEPPSPQILGSVASALNQSEIKELNAKLLQNKEVSLKVQYEVLVEQHFPLRDIVSVDANADRLVVSYKDGQAKAHILGAEHIGEKLSIKLQNRVSEARELEQTIQQLDADFLKEGVLKSLNDRVDKPEFDQRLSQTLALFEQTPSSDRPLLAQFVVQANDAEFQRLANNRSRLPEGSSTDELILTSFSSPSFNLNYKAEQRQLNPMHTEENRISGAKNAPVLPHAEQFAGTHFYFEPALNPVVEKQIASGQREAGYFEQLHEAFPQGISYSTQGIPQLEPVSFHESNGELSWGKEAKGKAVIVDLADPIELEVLHLDRKISGLTEVTESEAKDPAKRKERNQERYEEALIEDRSNADRIMRARYKKLGYGKWEKPADAEWQLIPNTHQYMLVPKTILETIGYTAKTRQVHLQELPAKPEIISQDTPEPNKLVEEGKPIIIIRGNRTFRNQNGRYEEWNGLEWKEVSKEEFEGVNKTEEVDINIPEITNKKPDLPQPNSYEFKTNITEIDSQGNIVLYTSKGKRIWASGLFDFIIDSQGRLQTGKGHMNIAVNSNSETVQAAGRMRLDNGRILRIDNESGHFRPTFEEMKNIRIQFEKLGANVEKTRIEITIFDINGRPIKIVDEKGNEIMKKK